MPQLRYSDDARDDLEDIAGYIYRQSAGREVARSFIRQLHAQCEKLASYRGTLGVARPELRSDLRFIPFGNYSIFFRYCGDALEIVAILESHRDPARYFQQGE